MENTEPTLEFFSRLRIAGKKPCRIFVNLEPVTKITADALLLLLSMMKHGPLKRCVAVGGNEPKDPKVREMFAQSGFYENISNRPEGYKRSENSGIMKKHQGKRVQQSTCMELGRYAANRLFGSPRKNGGLYRCLIELMANTKDHAHPGGDTTEAWLVTAYFDAEAKTVHFAFLDNGVGIFKSTRMQGALRLMGRFTGLVKSHEILMDILEAKLASRTGLPYRGKGLPAIYRALGRGDIHNLKIVTNDAYLDAASRTGKQLKEPFRGTCLTWEIRNA